MGAWASLVLWKDCVLDANTSSNKMHYKFQPCKKLMPIFLPSHAFLGNPCNTFAPKPTKQRRLRKKNQDI
jgi:hypothetical protein